ncbi:MAG: D-Ala-D-Ala carboxypeptidase family metallohydrolase [Parabacteroides sp.]|nr:D-Ala-D-Ala carboxypeptidase family metallohydrolase [Parabacteroides sp.]
MKKMSEHFSYEELTDSRVAVQVGLDNSPAPEALAALQRLSEHLLEPLRKLLGSPIKVTSGYRSVVLNRLVGGVDHSQHVKGEAADCYTSVGAEHLLHLLQASGLSFDQAILYRKKNFLHLSYRDEKRNRKMVIYK